MKLILVAGMSGSGKSTTSKLIYNHYIKNGYDAVWLHEESQNHPIRWANGGEFNNGSYESEEGMLKNIQDYFLRWETFLNNIKEEHKTYILEGCIFQPIIRYFFESYYSDEQILSFYQQFFKLFFELNTTLVFLYPENPESTLKNAFSMRGERWKNIILSPDHLYFHKHHYEGDQSIYHMWTHYRDLSNKAFQASTLDKMMIKVSDNISWRINMEIIYKHLNLIHHENKSLKFTFPTGILVTEEGLESGLSLNKDEKGYYISVHWWEKMYLYSTSENTLEAFSFPITLTFEKKYDLWSIHITGDYDWSHDQKIYHI
ncbi:MAG: hypothetical protein JXR88_07770 [Clostridia bacterium]|nr:hypothetical protein [Clostridia bacterium]